MSEHSDLVVRFMSGVYALSPDEAKVVADWVIEDRRRICGPILESLSMNDLEMSYPIKETLRLAGLEPK